MHDKLAHSIFWVSLGNTSSPPEYPWISLNIQRICDTRPKTAFLAHYRRYKNGRKRTVDPKVEGSSPFGLVFLNLFRL